VDHQLRRNEGPGKFEGGLVIDEVVYDLSLCGCDDECGDVQTTGWFGRLDGPFRSDGPFADISATAVAEHALTSDELSYLAGVAGAIISEDSNGFVSVAYFDDAEELSRVWDRIVAECDESDDQSHLTVIEGSSAFYLCHDETGTEACMGDGVDQEFNGLTVGMPGFLEAYQADVDSNTNMYREAYFGGRELD
jgi:hypothetical protein